MPEEIKGILPHLTPKASALYLDRTPSTIREVNVQTDSYADTDGSHVSNHEHPALMAVFLSKLVPLTNGKLEASYVHAIAKTINRLVDAELISHGCTGPAALLTLSPQAGIVSFYPYYAIPERVEPWKINAALGCEFARHEGYVSDHSWHGLL